MPTLQQARQWYAEHDPVHGYQHIVRVYKMAERLAVAEGADLDIVRAAAILHDAEGPGVGDARLEHQQASAIFAGAVLTAEGWQKNQILAVQHCIRAHRFRDQSERPQTLEAMILFDADKLDAIGAIGAIRAIAYAVLAEQDLYIEPSERFKKTGEKEPGEPHTPYHEFLFKLSKLKDEMYTQTGRVMAEARHAFLEDFFHQLSAEIASER